MSKDGGKCAVTSYNATESSWFFLRLFCVYFRFTTVNVRFCWFSLDLLSSVSSHQVKKLAAKKRLRNDVQ